MQYEFFEFYLDDIDNFTVPTPSLLHVPEIVLHEIKVNNIGNIVFEFKQFRIEGTVKYGIIDVVNFHVYDNLSVEVFKALSNVFSSSKGKLDFSFLCGAGDLLEAYRILDGEVEFHPIEM